MSLRGTNTLCHRKFQIELDETDENGNSALHLAAKDSDNLNIDFGPSEEGVIKSGGGGLFKFRAALITTRNSGVI